MINILIAEDHQMMVDGIKAMLANEPAIRVVAEASNGIEALSCLEKNDIDIVLLDINMPVLDGVETSKKIKALYPMVKVIALSMYDEGALIYSMLKNGVKGYILKNIGKERLLEAIQTVYDGENYFSDHVKDTLLTSMQPGKTKSSSEFMVKLTRREKEIINLIIDEYTTAEIAEKLFISEKTVETHRKHVLQKLNVRNTAGLVRTVIQKGLLD